MTTTPQAEGKAAVDEAISAFDFVLGHCYPKDERHTIPKEARTACERAKDKLKALGSLAAENKAFKNGSLWRCPTCGAEASSDDNRQHCESIRDGSQRLDALMDAARQALAEIERLYNGQPRSHYNSNSTVRKLKRALRKINDLSTHILLG